MHPPPGVESANILIAERAYEAIVGFLVGRGMIVSRATRLVEDLGLDSQDIVHLILEVEAALGGELSDNALVLFVECPVGEICSRLPEVCLSLTRVLPESE
jgi:acyl carrier protein